MRQRRTCTYSVVAEKGRPCSPIAFGILSSRTVRRTAEVAERAETPRKAVAYPVPLAARHV